LQRLAVQAHGVRRCASLRSFLNNLVIEKAPDSSGAFFMAAPSATLFCGFHLQYGA